MPRSELCVCYYRSRARCRGSLFLVLGDSLGTKVFVEVLVQSFEIARFLGMNNVIDFVFLCLVRRFVQMLHNKAALGGLDVNLGDFLLAFSRDLFRRFGFLGFGFCCR